MQAELITRFFDSHKQIVVFDTEYTTWEGAMERKWSGPNEHRELVQIAAQIVDIESEKVIDSFERLVIPTINPILSDYFVSLTGITQAEVLERGDNFETVYQAFDTWTAGLPIFSFAQSLESTSDRGVLEENLRLYNSSLKLDPNRYGTLTALFRGAGIDTTKYSSGEIYSALQLPLEGHVHNAMHDVNSLVATLFAVKKLKGGD